MEAPPLVSIIMPTYDAKLFIKNAIQSVLAQTHQNWELLIVDDCSSDGTADCVRQEYGTEGRIFVLSTPCNSGPGSARNVALQIARGEWITVLDSDDAYDPNRLLRLLELAEKNDADCLADNHYIVNSVSGKIEGKAFSLTHDQLPLTCGLLIQNDGSPFRFSFGRLKPFVRRTLLQKNAISYPENVRIGEDFAFLFDVLKNATRAVLIGDSYYIYTLPIFKTKKPSCTKSRTVYGQNGLIELIRQNENLLQKLSPQENRYRPLLAQRSQRFKASLAFQAMKGRFLKRGFGTSFILFMKEDWLFYVSNRLYNLVQRTHQVRGLTCLSKRS